MSMFDDAIELGLWQLDGAAQVTITYRRKQLSASIVAVRAETAATRETEEGVSLRQTRRDYLVNVADLDLGHGPIPPAAGDEITDGSAKYEVRGLDPAEPPWEWSTRARTRYRIHTVEK